MGTIKESIASNKPKEPNPPPPEGLGEVRRPAQAKGQTNMRHYTYILTIVILTTIYACSNSQFSDKRVEVKVINIIQRVDSNTINIFKEWHFGTRGQMEIWTKQVWDSSYYCFYFKTDTIKLTVLELENFKKDFPYDFDIDTSKYHRATFLKINDTTICIRADGYYVHDYILSKSISLKKIFRTNDPFKYFKSLSDLKDSLGISGTFYRPDIGNFIQFYLPPQYILTYIPDKLNLNVKCKDVWLKEFSTGKIIKKNWNFRKLDKPIDNE